MKRIILFLALFFGFAFTVAAQCVHVKIDTIQSPAGSGNCKYTGTISWTNAPSNVHSVHIKIGNCWSGCFNVTDCQHTISAADNVICSCGAPVEVYAYTGGSCNGTNVCTTLPIYIETFSAAKSGENVDLKWTANVVGTSNQFTVERSTDGTIYTSITTITASIAVTDYNYTDNIKQLGGNIFYRLKMISDNAISYSDVKSVYLGMLKNPLVIQTPGMVHVASPQAGLVQVINFAGQRIVSAQIAAGSTADLSLTPAVKNSLCILVLVDGSGKNLFTKQIVVQ